MIEISPLLKPHVRREFKPEKLTVVSIGGKRVNFDDTFQFDIDQEMHRREENSVYFPLDEYEDLGSYIERAYD